MNLENLGISPKLKYECIYTTISKNGVKDAAPIGFTYLGDDKVQCTIFKDAQTLKNIQETGKYVVNITQDPMTFAYATIANVPEDYFTADNEIAILKDTPSYLVIEVINMKKLAERDIYEITGEIKDINVNDDSVKAFNRGMGCLIDSLVNYTRYHIVDEKGRKYFDERLEENQRIINKVADSKTIEAMELLKKNQEK